MAFENLEHLGPEFVHSSTGLLLSHRAQKDFVLPMNHRPLLHLIRSIN